MSDTDNQASVRLRAALKRDHWPKDLVGVSPTDITTVCDALDRAEAEVVRLQAELDEAVRLLRGEWAQTHLPLPLKPSCCSTCVFLAAHSENGSADV